MVEAGDLVELASDAAFAVIKDLRIVAWNKAAEDLLGYPTPEVVGRRCDEVLQAILPGGEPLCTPACEGSLCFAQGRPFAVQSCLVLHRDGRWVPLGLSTMVMAKKAGSARRDATKAIVFLRPEQGSPLATRSAQPLRIYTLGHFGLVLDGHHVAIEKWARKQSLTLLKFLVTHRGAAVRRERLIEHLWPEVDEVRGRNRLKVTMSFLRQGLATTGTHHDFILTVGDSYVLRRESIWVDADVFERLVMEGAALERGRRWDEALRCYMDALLIYQGDYLEEDLYADSSAEERVRLRENFFHMLARMAEIYAGRGRYAEAAQTCHRALVREPCRESFHYTLMKCLVRLGRSDQALAQFGVCQRVLADELGVEPMSETRRLHRQILQARTIPHAETAPYMLD
jgi:PAS domain S-box-containing protein